MNNQWKRIFSRMDCPVRQIHNLYITVKYAHVPCWWSETKHHFRIMIISFSYYNCPISLLCISVFSMSIFLCASHLILSSNHYGLAVTSYFSYGATKFRPPFPIPPPPKQIVTLPPPMKFSLVTWIHITAKVFEMQLGEGGGREFLIRARKTSHSPGGKLICVKCRKWPARYRLQRYGTRWRNNSPMIRLKRHRHLLQHGVKLYHEIISSDYHQRYFPTCTWSSRPWCQHKFSFPNPHTFFTVFVGRIWTSVIYQAKV